MGRYSEFPRLLSWLSDRTCPDCGLRISNAPHLGTVRRTSAMGIPHLEVTKVSSQGYYLYLRPRGSARLLPAEVRFIHQNCLFRRLDARLSPIDMGPWWVPQVCGVRA